MQAEIEKLEIIRSLEIENVPNMKEPIPYNHPEREEFITKVAKEILVHVRGSYDISIQDLLAIMEKAKSLGLSQTKL